MTRTAKGANLPVPAEPVRIAVCRRNAPGVPVVDVSALLLDAGGRVRGDTDLVFYNQPAHPSGAVRHLGASADDGGPVRADWLWLDLAAVEPAVDRVVIAASADGGTFGQVPGLEIRVTLMSEAPVAYYAVADASAETAFVLGEFYRRDGGWKFRAVGQGYASGLAGLATDFGIEVEPEGEGEGHGSGQPDPGPDGPAVYGPAVYGPSGFRPYETKGSGARTLTVPDRVPPGPVLLEVGREDRDGYVEVGLEDGPPLWRSERPMLRGRFVVRVPEGRRLRLAVKGTGRWTLSVLPLGAAEPLTGRASGHGPDVLRYEGPAGELRYRLDASRQADRDFSLAAAFPGDDPLAPRQAPAPTPAPAGDAGDTAQGSVAAPGPCLLQVRAAAFWSLTSPSSDEVLAEYWSTVRTRRAPLEVVNPTPGAPVVLEYDLVPNSPVGWFEAYESDAGGAERPLPLPPGSGARGRALLFADGRAATRIRFKGLARWSLRLLPLSSARVLADGVEGRGTEVLAHRGDPVLLALTSPARRAGFHQVQAGPLDALSPAVVLAQTGGEGGRGPVQARPGAVTWVSVGTRDGQPWVLGVTGVDEARAFDSEIAGEGHDVIHYTGRPGDARLECGEEAAGESVDLWLLDKNLAPDRRLASGRGRHPLEPGLIQVRGRSRWTLTVGG
ncbi:TerD family protein [Streptomyces sp. NPDC046915]|uniref:TerD family protein n=1 Tax=Streptomyces sp. NPDC046915 TaxID=3155257 RepID=UPI00340AB464